MDRKIEHKENIISGLLFIGLTLSLIFLYFAQERLYNRITTGDLSLGPERYIRIISVITIFLTVLISLFASKANYKISIYFAYFILLFYITLSYIFSGADILNMSQFMDEKGIGTWVSLGLVFVSYHDKRYNLFNKFLLFASVYIAFLAFYNLIDFGIGAWRGQALSKYQVYATNYMWISPYVFLTLKNNKSLKWLRIFVFMIGLILALIIQTRSFLIIYFIVLIFDFIHTKKKASYTFLIIIGLAGLAYLILNTEMLSTSFELLINRGTHDTRSEQLSVFISQLNPIELVTGQGYFASYGFGMDEWTAVDNQWLFLLWWGGIIPFGAYFYLSAIIPLKMILKGDLNYQTAVECFILILWTLALTGLAIFSTMSIDFFFFVICIILGRILYKYSVNESHIYD